MSNREKEPDLMSQVDQEIRQQMGKTVTDRNVDYIMSLYEDSMQDDMVNRIRNYGGVWMSKRVFWWCFGINAGAWIFTLTFILVKIIFRIQSR